MLWLVIVPFVIGWFFRLWWVAALITAAAFAMTLNAGLSGQVIFVVLTAVPAFACAALGKFLKRRSADPFDPTDARGSEV